MGMFDGCLGLCCLAQQVFLGAYHPPSVTHTNFCIHINNEYSHTVKNTDRPSLIIVHQSMTAAPATAPS